MKSVVTIAGSDSSGGAGIQADLKAISAQGVFAQSVITALTAQNTMGVSGVFEVAPAFVEEQIDRVFEDIRPDAVKIGMLSSPELAEAVARALKKHGAENIVLDPVMVATSGASLSSNDAIKAVVDRLFPLATLVTPNCAEAEVLSGIALSSKEKMVEAAYAIQALGTQAVLVKGGDIAGFDTAWANDFLLTAEGEEVWLSAPRIDTKNTHGTGCTLSSAIAAYLALGCSVSEAVERAKAYLTEALSHDMNLGKGRGPINHFYMLAK